MNSVLSSDRVDLLSDLVLVSGDFNLSAKPIDPIVADPLLTLNLDDYKQMFAQLNLEYPMCKLLLSQNAKYTVHDLLLESIGTSEYPKHICTFGDYVLDKDQKPQALD